MFKCDICGKEFEQELGLRGHHMSCVKKNPRAEEDETPRTERIPFGSPRYKLHADGRPGYKRRFFNGNWRKEPGRINRAEAAGWRIVKEFESVSVGSNEDGSEIKGVLMEIPEQFFNEDKKAKQQRIKQVMNQIYDGGYQSQIGKAHRYTPDTGITITENTSENG